MPRIKPITAVLILVVVSLAVWARTLVAQFVLWDDDLHIINNPYLHPVTAGNVLYFWRNAFVGLYVPLAYTVYALLTLAATRSKPVPQDYVDPNLDPHIFHAANVLLQCLNVALVYMILRALTRRSNASVIGALLFCVHPLQVESVAWISELRGLLSGTFSLLSILFYVRFIRCARAARGAFSTQPKFRRGQWRAYCVAFAAFVLAMLSKPEAAALPLVFVVIDHWCLRRSLKAAAVAAAPFAVLLIPFILVTQSVQPVAAYARVPLWQRPFVAGDALTFYMSKLVLPINLAIDYGRRPDVVLRHAMTYAEWLIPAAAAFLIWRLRRPAVTAGALIALAFLLPVLGLTPFIFQELSTVSDRYCYMALFGCGLAVAALVARWSSRPVYVVAALLLIAAAGVSIYQEGYWNNSISLFTHAISENPTSGLSYQNLGNAYLEAGDNDRAMASYTRAGDLQRRDPRPFFAIGCLLMDEGRPDPALRSFQRAVAVSPRLTEGYYKMGQIYQDRGDDRDALAEFSKAVQLDPARAEARVNIAMILIGEQHYAPALAELEAGVPTRPDYAPLHEALGVTWERMGNPLTAESELRAAVGFDPDDDESRLLHGIVLMQLGQRTEGRAEIDKARALYNAPGSFRADYEDALSLLGLKTGDSADR